MSHNTNPVSMDTQVAELFGRVLRAKREGKEISQQDLAFASGLDRTYISLLERGLRQPSLTSILNLSLALEIEPWVLIKEMGNSEKDKTS